MQSVQLLSFVVSHGWASEACGGEAGQGMRNYVGVMRKQFRDHLVVEDSGAIQKSTKYHGRLPCGVGHPGLCPEKEPAIFANGLCVMTNLEAFVMKHCTVGTYIRVTSDPPTMENFYYVGYIRKGSPVCVVVIKVHLVHERERLCFTAHPDHGFTEELQPILFSTVAAEFLRQGPLDSFFA